LKHQNDRTYGRKKLATIPGNQNLRLVSQRWKRKNWGEKHQ